MKKETTERFTRSDLPAGQTDWDRVDALSDREIRQAMDEDPDAAPPLHSKFFEGAALASPAEEGAMTVRLRLPTEVRRFYQRYGAGAETVIEAALIHYARVMELNAVSLGPVVERVSDEEVAAVVRELLGEALVERLGLSNVERRPSSRMTYEDIMAMIHETSPSEKRSAG